MIVKRQQQVGVITGAQHLTAPDADLEDGRPSRDGRRDGHESHDLLLTASSEPGQEAADRLNAVLRIPGDPDDALGNGSFWCLWSRRGGRRVAHVRWRKEGPGW